MWQGVCVSSCVYLLPLAWLSMTSQKPPQLCGLLLVLARQPWGWSIIVTRGFWVGRQECRCLVGPTLLSNMTRKVILLLPCVVIKIVLLRFYRRRHSCRFLTNFRSLISVSLPKDKVKKVEKKGEWIERRKVREGARERKGLADKSF